MGGGNRIIPTAAKKDGQVGWCQAATVPHTHPENKLRLIIQRMLFSKATYGGFRYMSIMSSWESNTPQPLVAVGSTTPEPYLFLGLEERAWLAATWLGVAT